MESYQKDYLIKLGPRIEALQAVAIALSSNFDEAAASARRIAHTLRGSGGTYGFPEISSHAGLVEDSPAGDLSHELNELIKYLRSLTRSVDTPEKRILIIDDSAEIRLILGTILTRQGYQVVAAETAGEAREKLKSTQVSLILLDLVLPDTDGRNYLIELKDDLATASIPIIILSAKSSAQTKSECYALGAKNYFEKPVDPGLLTTTVAAALQTNQKLEHSQQKDEETGALNRAEFRAGFDLAVAAAPEKYSELCLAIIDITKFDNIEEQQGHLVGDEVLKHTARIIQQILRSEDLFGHRKGGEYTILFPAADCELVKPVLMKALDSLQNHPYHMDGGKPLPVLSFSAGVVELSSSSSFQESIERADKLLYAAKEAGHPCVFTDLDQVTPSQKSILLAEDDDLTADFIFHRLSKSDFLITRFPQGDMAYESAVKVRYDLVITDVKMPGMDGFELVQHIRKKSANQSTPIIMLTSMGRESDISRGLDLGANDYILKPFSPTELQARVRRLLK